MVDYGNKLAVQALELLKPECDKIIWSNCSDKLEIERVLDRLLDFCFDEKILKVYRKLYRYYYNIDAAATAQYVNAYREMKDKLAEAVKSIKMPTEN